MKSAYKSHSEKRHSSRGHVALHTETRKLSDVEELYWFAMALTGDPDFAAELVTDAGQLTSTAHGIFRD